MNVEIRIYSLSDLKRQYVFEHEALTARS